MKRISLIALLSILILGCSKKKQSEAEKTTPPSSTPTTTTTPTPVVTDQKWQVIAFGNSTTMAGYYDSSDIGDVYLFQPTGGPTADYFTLNQGATQTYSWDPQILTGHFTLSGTLLKYSNNGYELNNSWVQFNINYLTKDTLQYSSVVNGNTWLLFKAIP